MNNREFEMAAAVVAPEGSRRALSAGSLLMLEMLGNPLASLDEAAVDQVDQYSLAEFAWVHEAPLGRVQSAAVVARGNAEGIRAVVLEWAEAYPVSWVQDCRDFAREQLRRAASCMAVHEKPADSKNGSGPCLW